MAKKINVGTQAKIVSKIQKGILSGKYKPMEVLDKRSYFIKKYNTTPITVQRAFNNLIEYGFVTTKARVGTFVAERPPNLFRYALVFARDRKHADWTRFWQLMIDNKSLVEKELNIDIEIYEGLEYEEKSADYLRFLRDKQAGAFAGVIFTSELLNFPEEIINNLDVPCVAISSSREIDYISNINIDRDSFHRQLSEKIAQLGCVRAAFMVAEDYTLNREDNIKFHFNQNNLNYEEDFIQSFSVKEPFWTKRFISLMLKMPIDIQPDCFVVIDDNFLPNVFEQLIGDGKKPGKDIQVVSHANFPIDYDKYPGVHFVGYDVIEILRTSSSVLRSGQSEGREILVKAITLSSR